MFAMPINLRELHELHQIMAKRLPNASMLDTSVECKVCWPSATVRKRELNGYPAIFDSIPIDYLWKLVQDLDQVQVWFVRWKAVSSQTSGNHMS